MPTPIRTLPHLALISVLSLVASPPAAGGRVFEQVAGDEPIGNMRAVPRAARS